MTPYGAAKAAAETAVRLLHTDAVVARTWLIIGDGRSAHERVVRELAAGAGKGALFTDDIRCPVHVADLEAALWECAVSDAARQPPCSAPRTPADTSAPPPTESR